MDRIPERRARRSIDRNVDMVCNMRGGTNSKIK
jgi:hypothetical protein